MKEKIIFDRESIILKSNIDFEKYDSLFSRIYESLDYAEANTNDLEGLRSLLFIAFCDHDVSLNFKMYLTKRNRELNISNFVYQCSKLTQRNVNIQKSGQNMIEKLNKHIEDCIERHVSFHSEGFDTACHLLIILEGLLPVMAERVNHFQGVVDEIRDAIFSDSARESLAFSSSQFNARIYLAGMDIAEYYYSNNDFTEALRLFTCLCEIGHREYLLEIGDCQLRLNRVDEAIQSYKLGIESGSTEGYLRIGDCLCGLNRFDEAMEYYQQAIEADEPDGYAHIGDYYAKTGNQEEAAAWYEKGDEAGSLEAGMILMDMKMNVISGALENPETAEIAKKAIDHTLLRFGNESDTDDEESATESD